MLYNRVREATQKPKTLFLIDGLGAFVTAFFLFVILRRFNDYFGMPQKALVYLSLIAVVFCLYSITCFFFLRDNWKPFLRAISIANLLYCCLTISLVIRYFPKLTFLGLTYFLVEIMIVCGLVFIELKTLATNDQKPLNEYY